MLRARPPQSPKKPPAPVRAASTRQSAYTHGDRFVIDRTSPVASARRYLIASGNSGTISVISAEKIRVSVTVNKQTNNPANPDRNRAGQSHQDRDYRPDTGGRRTGPIKAIHTRHVLASWDERSQNASENSGLARI